MTPVTDDKTPQKQECDHNHNKQVPGKFVIQGLADIFAARQQSAGKAK